MVFFPFWRWKWFRLFGFIWLVWFFGCLHDFNLLWFWLILMFLSTMSLIRFRLWLLWCVLVILHVVFCLLFRGMFLPSVGLMRFHLLFFLLLLLLLFSSLIFKSVYFLLDFNCELWGKRSWGLLRLEAIVNEEALD